MNSNTKMLRNTASRTALIPDSQDKRENVAYPSPPNSPRKSEGDVSAICENSSEQSYSSVGTILPTTSPKPVTHVRTLETNKGIESVQLEISTLKDRFGLNRWLCGGLTQKESPCKRPIAENLKNQINNHIETIIALQKSPLQLRTEIEKLVNLVHCHQHRRGYAQQMRLDTWMAVFPSLLGQATHPALIARKIELCFGRLTNECVGVTRGNKQCRKSIGGRKVLNRTQTITELSKAEIYMNEQNLDHFLGLVATYMHCYLHTNQSLSKEQTLWKERIQDISERASLTTGKSEAGKTEGDSGKKQLLENAPVSRNTSTKKKDALPSKHSHQLLEPSAACLDSSKHPPIPQSDQYDTTAFDIVRRMEGMDNYKPSYEAVRKQMMKRLGDKEQKAGYLYIYEDEGNKGLVKIGYTARTITKRHEEWCFDCNRKPKSLFPVSAQDAVLVPHVHRVEKLCHAELNHRQVIIYCYCCLKTHEEWFEVSCREAAAVIEKWSAWMKKEPYEPDTLSLREEEARKASNMGHYMTELVRGGN
ncbi:T5orf172 domain-containing protein [Aspergillus californicus]